MGLHQEKELLLFLAARLSLNELPKTFFRESGSKYPGSPRESKAESW